MAARQPSAFTVMWTVIVALAIMVPPPQAPFPAAPYVSCPRGYVAPTLDDCPDVEPTKADASGKHAGGGGEPGGLLGLGGLGGIL